MASRILEILEQPDMKLSSTLNYSDKNKSLQTIPLIPQKLKLKLTNEP